LNHEEKFIASGPITEDFYAESLSEWTTTEQRANALLPPVIYHAGDIPSAAASVIAESDAFVARVATKLSPNPVPISGHIYWLDSIHWITVDLAQDPDAYAAGVPALREALWDSPVFGPPIRQSGIVLDSFPPPVRPSVTLNAPIKRKILLWVIAHYSKWSGYPLHTCWWFPPHIDFTMLSNALLRADANIEETVWIMPPSNNHANFWPKHYRHLLHSPLILYREPSVVRAELGRMKHAVIFLPLHCYAEIIEQLVAYMAKVLPSGSHLHLFVCTNGQIGREAAYRAYTRYSRLSERMDVMLTHQQHRGDAVLRLLSRWLYGALQLPASRRKNSTFMVLRRVPLVGLLHIAFFLYTAACKLLALGRYSMSADSFILSYKISGAGSALSN
jgi:hypothetical protein